MGAYLADKQRLQQVHVSGGNLTRSDPDYIDFITLPFEVKRACQDYLEVCLKSIWRGQGMFLCSTFLAPPFWIKQLSGMSTFINIGIFQCLAQPKERDWVEDIQPY